MDRPGLDEALTRQTIRGRHLRSAHRERTDCAVIGSGPAGAAVARALAEAGLSVVIIEEGPLVAPSEYAEDSFSAMAQLYRDLGTTLSLGRPMMPLVSGRAVGGTSVINGAISWRLPRDIHAEWVAADPALGEALPFSHLEQLSARIERELGIAPTDPAVAGRNDRLLARGAEALGLAHRPTRRNAPGCLGLGRCLQGCPAGRKASMDRSYLPLACARGARVYSEVRAERVLVERGRAVGVRARARGGGLLTIDVGEAVVVAASALYTPLLLLASGLDQGPVGSHFQCHPGVALTGRFSDPVDVWRGSTQGHEVVGLRREGIKFEALGYDLALAATRAPGYGAELRRSLADLRHRAHWGAAIRARARGRLRRGPGGTPLVRYTLQPDDVQRVRRGVGVLGRMMLAAGAQEVEPAVFGAPARIHHPKELDALERSGPEDPRAYSMAVTHMFGTCRMGSDPGRSVIRPDFRHHHVDALYVADASAFPSNTGVNPQTSIIALAARCAERIIEARSEASAARSVRRRDVRPAAEIERVTSTSDGAAALDPAALVEASRDELRALWASGLPIAPHALDDSAYHGVSLGLPRIVDRLLWKRFIKVFARAPDQTLHGWNVRVDQRGGDYAPIRRDASPLCFGPYLVRQPTGGDTLLDYGPLAGGPLDPLRLMRDPLVALDGPRAELLLGYSYLELAGRALPTPSWFLLQRAGPLSPELHGRSPAADRL